MALCLAQRNRPTPSMQGQVLPAAVHLPVKLRVAERTLDCHRQAHADVSVPRAGVDICLEVARQRQVHAPVARSYVPTTSHFGSRQYARIHAPITGFDREAVETPRDPYVAVSAVSVQLAVQLPCLDRAVPRMQLYISLARVHVDASVVRMEINGAG